MAQPAKKSVVKKPTQAAIRKASKTVSEKAVKKAKPTEPRKMLVKFTEKGVSAREVKPKAPSEMDKKIIGAYLHGRAAGAESEKLEQKIRESQMQAGPAITARLSFELDEANNCKINVSGDFNVILKKMHEIQDQSIKIDNNSLVFVLSGANLNAWLE